MTQRALSKQSHSTEGTQRILEKHSEINQREREQSDFVIPSEPKIVFSKILCLVLSEGIPKAHSKFKQALTLLAPTGAQVVTSSALTPAQPKVSGMSKIPLALGLFLLSSLENYKLKS